jgi:hypothetical protein
MDYHKAMWKSLKPWPVLLALLVAVGALAVGLLFLPRGGPVTPETCERVKEGMTEAEVGAILGKPFDDSLLDPEPLGCEFQWVPLQEDGSSELKAPAYNYFWVGGSLVLFVVFDHDGRVVSRELASGPDCPRSSWLPARVWRRLRERYGW